MTSARIRQRPGAAAVVGALVAVGAALAASAGPAAAAPGDDDPNLEQAIDAAEPVATGTRVLSAGHVDLGPKFVDGQWRFMIHDDAAKADASQASVWRHPDQTVLHVLDQAKLPVPDDPAYQFVGAEPGQEVWVVPQTQNPAVVWLGWNTQDPEVMESIDRGVTLSLTGSQGPGTVTAFLQSGSFGEPQVLFDSRAAEPQDVWVDVNTHTHANWVFTEPGVYLLRLQVAAVLVDGSSARDSQVFRFAVGTATRPEEALAAVWPESDAAGDAEASAAAGADGSAGADADGSAGAGADAAAPGAVDGDPATGGGEAGDPAGGASEHDSAGGGVNRALLLGGIGLAAALAITAAAILVRARRAKNRVFAARQDRGPGSVSGAGAGPGSGCVPGSGLDSVPGPGSGSGPGRGEPGYGPGPGRGDPGDGLASDPATQAAAGGGDEK
ncbi:MAG: choice-of-anchor M domain-containing protein [Bifidobacteriaceae bacterium]|jgi:surface-anchored protein|nr:choice-of-anchor M domain-containing protein [Bifidobacteriaceae bacterium]